MNCWFWNIYAGSREFLWKELQAGKLRQGWGYDERLDLRKLKKRMDAGEKLQDREQVAWDRCAPMLQQIETDDLVVVKNVPEHNSFGIFRVTGPYLFDWPTSQGDFGHCLPCKQVCAPFRRKSEAVPGPLARALAREQNPIRVTYKHAGAVEQLARMPDDDPDRSRTNALREALDQRQQELANILKEKLWERIEHRATEELVEFLLHRTLGAVVRRTAGPAEQGADCICDVPLGMGLATRIAVQVKMHRGTDSDLTGLEQIERAIKAHDTQAGLLVTLADSLGENVQQRLAEMQKTMKVDVLFGEELYLQLLALVADPGEET